MHWFYHSLFALFLKVNFRMDWPGNDKMPYLSMQQMEVMVARLWVKSTSLSKNPEGPRMRPKNASKNPLFRICAWGSRRSSYKMEFRKSAIITLSTWQLAPTMNLHDSWSNTRFLQSLTVSQSFQGLTCEKSLTIEEAGSSWILRDSSSKSFPLPDKNRLFESVITKMQFDIQILKIRNQRELDSFINYLWNRHIQRVLVHTNHQCQRQRSAIYRNCRRLHQRPSC